MVAHTDERDAVFCWLDNVQQHASVSQGRIRSILLAATLRQKLQVKLSTSPSHSILTPGRPVLQPPGAWQGSHCGASFEVTGMTRPGKIPPQVGFDPPTFRSRGGRFNHYANQAVDDREEKRCILKTRSLPPPIDSMQVMLK